MLTAGFLLLAGVITYVAVRRPDRLQAGAPHYKASIAILPFASVGSDSTAEYFSEGMTDEIITQLAQIPELEVISRSPSSPSRVGT